MTGEIDPAIAVLNGIGLLLYVVPGVIAFQTALLSRISPSATLTEA